MKHKYAFFLDFDGTLADHEFIPEENILAIAKARASGNPVFLNTGRAPAFIPNWIFDKVTFDGIVAGSGAYARIGDEVLSELSIENETIVKNIRFLQKSGRQCIFEGVHEVLVQNPHGDQEFPAVKDEQDFLLYHPGCGVEKLNLRGKLTFAERRYLSMFYTVIQHESYAECSIPSVNKGTALELVMQHYPEHLSVAIGDSPNDIDMLAMADISVAMGNAPESVRHICTNETLSVRDAGVAKAILSLIY